jgi:hypothetical protein
VAASDEWGLTIPLDPKYQPVIQAAAKLELTKMAGYGRRVLLMDLQNRGLLDENFEPVNQTAETTETPGE